MDFETLVAKCQLSVNTGLKSFLLEKELGLSKTLMR